MLGSSLSLLNQREEISFTFSEALLDSFNWILRELLILNNEVVQIVS
jgi:hypothetical protein